MPIDVKNLLQLMVQKEISDIHLNAGSPPLIRLHGDLRKAGSPPLSAEQVQEIAFQLMDDKQKAEFEKEHELDIAYDLPGVSRFRVNVYRQRGTPALVLRVVPLKVKTFEELQLPKQALERLAQETRGLILFAGITGAGKTTSVNSLVHYINNTYEYRIITIEDPIEFNHQDAKSSIVQREVGHDTHSFAAALKHALRQDPDVIVLGEMRDYETIAAGIFAAETGHLVLSTIHAMDAVQAIDRVIGAFPAHQQGQARVQVCNVLKGIVAQRLLPRASGEGRVPATEVLVMNSGIRRQILESKNADIYKSVEASSYYHMHTFDQDLLRLLKAGLIDQKTAIENATNPEDMALRVKTAVPVA